jgi:hypothetical protein
MAISINTRGVRRRALLAPGLLSCAVALAACGSSGASGNSSGSVGNPQGVAYADCMRSHAVPDFPDPTTNGGRAVPSTINASAPAFESATKSCAQLQPGPSGLPPQIPKSKRRRLLALAKCMRKHGEPQLPDPIFPSTGGVLRQLPPGVSITSAAFEQAARECGWEIRPELGPS